MLWGRLVLGTLLNWLDVFDRRKNSLQLVYVQVSQFAKATGSIILLLTEV